MKSILDRSFRYTPSFKTDVGKTFAAARRKLDADAERFRKIAAMDSSQVTPILRKARSG